MLVVSLFSTITLWWVCVCVCEFVRHSANRLCSIPYAIWLPTDFSTEQSSAIHNQHTTPILLSGIMLVSIWSRPHVQRVRHTVQHSTEYTQKEIVNICECLCGDWRNASFFIYTYILATTFFRFLFISFALRVTLYLFLCLSLSIFLVRSHASILRVVLAFIHLSIAFTRFEHLFLLLLFPESSLVRISFAPVYCFIRLVGLSVGLSIRSFHFVSLSYVHCTAKRQRIDEKTHVKTDLSGHFFAFVPKQVVRLKHRLSGELKFFRVIPSNDRELWHSWVLKWFYFNKSTLVSRFIIFFFRKIKFFNQGQ